MLSKEHKKELNTHFWESFKKHMRKYKSSNGRGINWINYPSDVKDMYIRLQTDNTGARLCLDIQPKDDGIRAILWEQMTELKRVMEDELGEAIWNEKDRTFNGRNVSRIYWQSDHINFYDPSTHPELQSYLENKLLEFDRFYQEYKDILIALAE